VDSVGSSSKRDKKLLAVQGDLAQKIIEIANRKGMTVYSFTNEVLEQVVIADGMNRSIKDIVESYGLLEIERDSGAVFATTDTLLYMVQRLYEQEKDALLKNWYESGQWFGKYLKIKFNEGEPLDMLGKLLEAASPKSSQIQIIRDEDKLSVSRLCPNDSSEYTELFSKFLEGIIHSFGFSTSKNDVSKGLIVLEFEKSLEDTVPKKPRRGENRKEVSF
jgi:hypothetical protein